MAAPVTKAPNPRSAIGWASLIGGNGYGREAVAAVIDYEFRTIGIETIRAYTDPSNAASQKVLLSAVFGVSPADHRNPVASRQAGARVEPDGVVPEELALAFGRHVPAEHRCRRFRKPALAVRVVRAVHQYVFAQELDHGVGQPLAFGDLDALEIAAAQNIFAGLVLQLG